MATYEQLPSGAWRAKVRRKGVRECKTFDTRDEAETWALTAESEVKRGIFVSTAEAERTTLTDALDRYARDNLPSLKSQATVRSQIKVICEDRIGSLSLAALSSSQLALFRDRRLQSVGGDSVRKDLALIRRVLNLAMREWSIALPHGNPVSQIALPKPGRPRERRLLPGEEGLLLGAAADYEASRSDSGPILAIIYFAIAVATRRGEVASVRWEHIDFGTRVLRIPETKTDEPRTVPLGPSAIVALCLALNDDAEHIPESGPVWGLRPDSITQAFTRVVERARAAYLAKCQEEGATADPRMLVDLRLHDLRHEATSRLFERGANPMQASAITGHKTLQMLKRYTHLRPADVRQFVE